MAFSGRGARSLRGVTERALWTQREPRSVRGMGTSERLSYRLAAHEVSRSNRGRRRAPRERERSAGIRCSVEVRDRRPVRPALPMAAGLTSVDGSNEPSTGAPKGQIPSKLSRRAWWAVRDSNPGPLA